MTQRLLASVFLPAFGTPDANALHDAHVLAAEGRLALTTDSFVVTPWRFPGGDIGSLAVHGTVNDLAMAGARPLAITAGFILEEGFPIASLHQVVDSMARAAREAGVAIVAGDTKVVEHGKGDGVYINTTGLGAVLPGVRISPTAVKPGDHILVSGDIGAHGAAVMTSREGLEMEPPVLSDSANVGPAALALIEAGLDVRCLRDCTRGGLATVLNEIAAASQVEIVIDEGRIPVKDDVMGVCELLGLDPLYVACEGRFAAIVSPEHSDRALAVLRSFEVSGQAEMIGQARAGRPGLVMQVRLGVERILDLLSGEQLPRIC